MVNSHPIQYFAPLYAYLSRDPSLEITVLYCSDFSVRGGLDPGFGQVVIWDVDILTGYRARWLGKRAKTRVPMGFWSLVCPELWHEIRTGRYDALWIHGYGYAAYVLAFLAAKSRGMHVLMRSETHLGLRRTRFRRALRDFVLTIAYKFVDGFLSIGTANRAYYRSLQVPERKIFDVPYTIDNERFISASALTGQERMEVKRQFGLPTNLPVVLYASKLVQRKRPDDVIRAMRQVQKEGVEASLLLVGTGEMEGEMRALAASLAIQNVAFGGFVNQMELPRVFAAADVFVLTSESEPWGLIVNEAMCAGLPIVISDDVGCGPDLVRHGENGYVVRTGKVEEIASALCPLLTNATLRMEMGRRSLERIREWSYARDLAGIRDAIVGLGQNGSQGGG